MALSKIVENSIATGAVAASKLKDFTAAVDLNGVELILDADQDTSITADTDDQIDIKISGADDFRFTANTFTALAGSGIVVPDGGLTFGSTAISATAAELNILDDATVTTAELNLIDGGTARGTTAVADADGLLHNDGGTMRMTSAATFKTYFQEGISQAYDDFTVGDAAVNITTSAGDITIDAQGNDTDIIFKGTDGNADTTFLTIDGSAAGEATFNAGIVIADAGTIGSASDKDAIAIGSDGDVTLTQDLELQHDGAILSFGANDEVTLTHVHDTGILLNSTNVIQFNDASQNIGAPSATVLDINATDEIELNATLADINANLDVSGTYTGGGLMTTGGNIVIPDAGNIGSASDTDAIAIASTGIVTFSQTPVRTGAVNNMIINGDMVVAQRGITITDAAVNNTSTTTNADDSYTLDRWILLSDGNDIVDVLQSDTSPNDGSEKTIQLQVETADKKFGIVQIIEQINCHHALASGKVSLSFKMKASDASIDDVRAAVVSWSGTADTVTSDIVSAWEAEGTNPTLITNATYENTPANLSPTTSFAEYKIENITVDTSNTGNLLVFIWSGVTDVEADDSLFITDVQLETGVAANEFVRKPIQQTILDCERYYETSMSWGEDSQTEGQPPSFGTGSATHAAATNSLSGKSYRTRKRTTPTATLYHQDGTAGAVYRIHDGGQITGIAAQFLNDYGFTFANKTSAFNQNYGYYYAYIAEAEL